MMANMGEDTSLIVITGVELAMTLGDVVMILEHMQEIHLPLVAFCQT